MSLNLSSQPFVNSRPVRRLVFVLWCLGVLLLAANLIFYTRHFSGQQDRRERLAELTEREAAERQRLAELEGELAGFDVRWQNRQAEFLNLRIAERVFPWSRLFDRLTEAMPGAVRLVRLRPQIHGLAGSEGAREETVRLEIRAESRNEEAMLDFIGRLFQHPAFRAPNLLSETRRGKSSSTEFSLVVIYLPARAEPTKEAAGPAPAVANEAAPPATEAPAADGPGDGAATEEGDQ